MYVHICISIDTVYMNQNLEKHFKPRTRCFIRRVRGITVLSEYGEFAATVASEEESRMEVEGNDGSKRIRLQRSEDWKGEEGNWKRNRAGKGEGEMIRRKVETGKGER